MLKMTRGYTLSEILIVVVIIAVLASLIIPRFTGQQERGHVAEAVGILSAIRQGETAYHLENKISYMPVDSADCTVGWEDIGVDCPAVGAFTYQVDAEGTATATRVGGGASFNNTHIILSIGGAWSGDHLFAPKNPNP